MPDPATTSDVREVASAVRDLAEATGTLGGATGRLEAKSIETERLLTEINTKLAPVAVFFEARNKEHATADAQAAEAGAKKKATLDEWAAWLTPTRAIGLITAIAALCGLGGPASGLTGRLQTAVNAAWTVLHEPEAAPAPPGETPS